MTAKELKEQALTEPLHLASYYRFNEKQLKDFCQQLCKERETKLIGEYQFEQEIKNERDRLLEIPENNNREFLAGWNAGKTFGIALIIDKIQNAPMPEL